MTFSLNSAQIFALTHLATLRSKNKQQMTLDNCQCQTGSYEH